MKYNFDYAILDAINNAIRTVKASPLALGGATGSGGGVGGPPGGFIGTLPQTRVSYDLSEIASSGLPVSGWSLLDNLNHIRYRVESLENGSLSVYNDGVLVASGVLILDFVGESVSAIETSSGDGTIKGT